MRFELDQFHRNIADQELLDDLIVANANAAGKPLTFRSYREHGRYSASTINDRFGSWNNAIRLAGLIPTNEKNASSEALFDNLKIVWIAKSRQPVYRDMAVPPSHYSGSTYSAQLGGWRNALVEFVAAVEQEQFQAVATLGKGQRPKRNLRDPSLSLRFVVLRRDNFCCVACGRSPATVAGLILEVDHVRPWSKGARRLRGICNRFALTAIGASATPSHLRHRQGRNVLESLP